MRVPGGQCGPWTRPRRRPATLSTSATAEAAAPAPAPAHGRPSEAQSTSNKYAVIGEDKGAGRGRGGAWEEDARRPPCQPPSPPPPPSPEIGGTQLLVEEGRLYSTDRLAAAAGSTVALGRVLAVKDGAAFRVGAPYLSDASVEARIVEDEAKGPKLTVFKYKRKDHYKRKTGHRQPLTTFVVTKIA